MPALTDEIKEFIVKGLACFDTPSEVAEGVCVNFGITVSRQQVFSYDPDGSRPPAERWSALHAATRAKFLSEIAGIGIAHKAVRLRLLERYVRHSEKFTDRSDAAALLEQAAKECGGIYESRKTASPKEMPLKHPVP